ncbi:MAG: hypothetical protein H6745_04170 [Deltaproteobacteria bacterium]|nr:hypothetical protein [Deltaproteobacteria bacterium]
MDEGIARRALLEDLDRPGRGRREVAAVERDGGAEVRARGGRRGREDLRHREVPAAVARDDRDGACALRAPGREPGGAGEDRHAVGGRERGAELRRRGAARRAVGERQRGDRAEAAPEADEDVDGPVPAVRSGGGHGEDPRRERHAVAEALLRSAIRPRDHAALGPRAAEAVEDDDRALGRGAIDAAPVGADGERVAVDREAAPEARRTAAAGDGRRGDRVRAPDDVARRGVRGARGGEEAAQERAGGEGGDDGGRRGLFPRAHSPHLVPSTVSAQSVHEWPPKYFTLIQ